MNFCNNESILSITWNFLGVIDLQNERNKIYSNIYNVIPLKGVSFVPSNVSAWAQKIPPSQKSRYLDRNLRIRVYDSQLLNET